MTRPDYWLEAARALANRDAVMARLVAAHKGFAIGLRGDAFQTLARAIVGQQISVKAAQTVWDRFADAVQAVEPARVARAKADRLRAAGLSARKVEYVRDLARTFSSGTLDPTAWPALDDEALIERLTEVRGIGRWTAEMFLIFYLLRPDVLPLDDIGLQRAMRLHYNGDVPLARLKMRKIADAWSPWRSVATWYLWRSLDPVPVEY